MALHDRHRQWLDARGISVDLAMKLGLETVEKDGARWLAVPYVENDKVVNHKYRLTSEKRHQMDRDARLTLWNHDCLLEESDRPVVIFEGEWDAMIALQLGWRAVSVPNGAPAAETEDPANAKRYEYLWNARAELNAVKQFILATDSDAAGQALRADLVALLGADRCAFVPDYGEGCKDLSDTYLIHGVEAAAAALNNAKPVPVKGLYRIADFPEAPAVASTLVQIEGLDDLFSLVPGTFTVISGFAGHGKTSLLMKMLANLLGAGVSIAIGSFETIPRPILERRLRAAMMEIPEYQANRRCDADDVMAARLSVIANAPADDETDLDIDYIIDLAKVAVARDGVKLLVLDPWNEIEHKRLTTETETEYVGRSIRHLKRFARNHDCAVWVVAHPRKPHSDGNPKPPSLYDISSSAHFANKADFGMIVHRDDLAGTMVEVRVVKVRMGLPGKIGKAVLDFDHRFSRYTLSPFHQTN